MWSVRRRLLGWLLPGIVISCLAATLAIYTQTSDEVDEVFDRQLQQMALSLGQQQDLSVGPGALLGDVEADDEIVSSAWDVNGRPIFGLAGVRPIPSSNQRGFLTENWN